MEIVSVGIDLGKTTFHLVALGASRQGAGAEEIHSEAASDIYREHAGVADRAGGMLRSALSRTRIAEARPYVRLIAAQFVKPFVKSNKNDFMDAEAIAEAVERKNMRFVPIKTDDQLDLQGIHRVRDRLISRRTAVINQMRAFLLERGMVLREDQRSSGCDGRILENAEADLTPQMRGLIDMLWEEWKLVEEQIEKLSLELERISAADPGVRGYDRSQGSGQSWPQLSLQLSATAPPFRKGRDFAAWLGIVPRQYSTGGKASCSASASVATSTCGKS